jgi:hypothetical protein
LSYPISGTRLGLSLQGLVYPCKVQVKHNLGTKSVIAFSSDCLQLREFVKAIAYGGVTTLESSLDESPLPFTDIASRNANQLLSLILNEGI